MQVQPDTRTLAPFVPRALLARLARPIEVLAENVDSTMVFADVSGFTRLSERLARRGYEGGEQLVDVINACFTALLAEAYGRGGSLVKFGGDAMVLLFYDQEQNQDHALRACCAAAAMRRRIRELGRVRAGASNVQLRMSVGVHSGEYAMFVVGGSHREMVIGGAEATKVVGLEAVASAGQVLVSHETAQMLPVAPSARTKDPVFCSHGRRPRATGSPQGGSGAQAKKSSSGSCRSGSERICAAVRPPRSIGRRLSPFSISAASTM